MAKDEKENDKIDIANTQLIRKILKDISKQKSPIKIWQSYDETHYFAEGTIHKYNGMQDRMEVRAAKGHLFNFDPKKELFFHSGYKELIFKTKIDRVEDKEVWIYRPSILKIDDSRATERKNFGLQSYQTAILVFDNQDQMKVNVLDISEGGMAILIRKPQYEQFHMKLKLLVKESSVDQCVGKICIVRNKAPVDKVLTNEQVFRIGFEFLN
ncbi:MAG: PilZ domain-containing protein [Bacteriovoracaceae bacterium]|nr:PilZ domain-containing protein [Bacteriovoracaceae bacterium]